MRVCYSPGYCVGLPEGHRFPMEKYPELHRILLEEGLIRPEDVREPREADWRDLERVHTADYLSAIRHGTLEPAAERRIGFPVSEAMVRRSRLAVQGTIETGAMAIEDGASANLAGGMHHAFPDHGEGFCILNDVAVACRVLQSRGAVDRVLVVDLDVHQGNGTAEVFAGDDSVTTFSMHAERNYPLQKAASDRDVGLPDGTDDGAYLETLATELPGALSDSRPDLIYYLAGVDPLEGDRLGRLALSQTGLADRDRLVMESTKAFGVSIGIVPAGGYAGSGQETADLHAIVYRTAVEVFG